MTRRTTEAASSASRVQRVLHVVEVHARELLHDARHRRVLEREIGVLGDPGGGQHQRERVPSTDRSKASDGNMPSFRHSSNRSARNDTGTP